MCVRPRPVFLNARLHGQLGLRSGISKPNKSNAEFLVFGAKPAPQQAPRLSVDGTKDLEWFLILSLIRSFGKSRRLLNVTTSQFPPCNPSPSPHAPHSSSCRRSVPFRTPPVLGYLLNTPPKGSHVSTSLQPHQPTPHRSPPPPAGLPVHLVKARPSGQPPGTRGR